MNIVEKTIQTYNRTAAPYCAKTRREEFLKQEEEYIKKMLSLISAPAPLILDVGCGDGRQCATIEKLGAKAVGIDLSDGMLDESRILYPEGDFRRMDMRRLAFGDDSFDGIWSSGSIYHVTKADIGKVISEFARVLRPGGVVALNFKLGDGEGLEQKPKSYSGPVEGDTPRYFAYYTKAEMTSLFAQHGFHEFTSTTFPQEIFGDDIQMMWFGLRKRIDA